MTRLVADIGSVVEDELRAFNVERLYAGERGVTPVAIVESCRLLPMMSDRRVVVVLRGERLLKPKRRGPSKESKEDEGDEGGSEPASDLDVLDEYIKRPESSTTLVVAAADVDRSRRLGKTLYKLATVVECWGLKPGRDARGADLWQATRLAEQLVKKAAADAGQKIEAAAVRLVATRAGMDIARLRGDMDRLLLYAAGRPAITLVDALEVVSAESAQDDWAVTNAIQQGNAAEALRQLALALDGGGVPYMILGQLAWFVRERLADARRIPAAVEALFRTDVELKSSGGDPRVLLERLVVELCGRVRPV
jgi:DNA polymerase III delta subunit